MIKCPDVPLFSVGIIGLKFITLPEPFVGTPMSREVRDGFRQQGCDARNLNLDLKDNPYRSETREHKEWVIGWCIVDYAMNHPEENA